MSDIQEPRGWWQSQMEPYYLKEQEESGIKPGYTLDVLDKGFVRYIDHMGSDERIVECARISYKSPSKGKESDEKLLKYLYKNHHTSPFESCKITFNIKLPIFIMRQFVRHRMQNLNEVSARYTELPCEFYIPGEHEWRVQDTKNKQGSIRTKEQILVHKGPSAAVPASFLLWTECKKAYVTYQKMLSAGICREQARMILPVNIYTEIYSTWDLHNLMHFLRLREESHAQAEMQEYAKAMKKIVKQIFPVTIETYEESMG